MKHLSFFISMIILTLVLIPTARADLLVTPKRVIFEDRDRTQQIVLINSGNKTRSYRLNWIEQEQLPNGSYKLLSEEQSQGRKKASAFTRFSPRQVRLAPGQRQVIKILARRSASMEPGEYRSHLLFSALPAEEETEETSGEGMRMKLNVLVSYSIPVVLNVAYKEPQISISDMNVIRKGDDAKKYADIALSFNKSGDFATYGKIRAFFQANGADDYSEVAILNGVSIYAESNVYKANLAWIKEPSVQSGNLKITYDGDAERNGIKYVEQVYSINL